MNTKTTWVVVVLIVLVLAGLFFYFGGHPDTAAVRDATGTATTTAQAMDHSAARAKAAADLTALKARQQAGESYESLKGSYAEVRANLAASYQNADAAAAAEWADISASFDSFEASARAGTGNVLDSLASLIAKLSADVRTETPGE